MPLMRVNLAVVLAAAVARMVLGSLWFSPTLFGKPWLSLMGWSKQEIEKRKQVGMGRTYVLAFAGSFVMAFVFAQFVNYAQANGVVSGALTGCWLWLGFIATSSGVSSLFEGRPLKLHLIGSGYELANAVVMGAILGKWA